ncbi:LytR C-terminal domain-containing protein [Phytoactinopolyspora mesophila]|uniref:LytR/CpsA/Psr regulator C-terminal domain-containing protein n=1 Tax=Phytoactinopolyspora mesophila TaxID=2650750 RepID=A0A7K3MCN2_9ACTN|nr:LytR C-terminal domain-containing protein [Phytoactinopolyspora mesophila]NDL61004.1 hypothetical protein [Phytoactinopolyspora mesophila]
MEPDEYAEEYEDAPRHIWRHVRTAITLLVLVGFVVGAAWYSWNNVVLADDDTGDAPRAEPTCVPVTATDAPEPDSIEVNIYNSTTRRGLAGDVAAEMSDRGFTILDVANDPLDSNVEGTAEVRSSADQEVAASVVAALVPDAVLVSDDRSSDAVDLVLGEQFDELIDDPDAEATLEPC